jgi:RNA polymerase sigma factor for flagellar operon FliA
MGAGRKSFVSGSAGLTVMVTAREKTLVEKIAAKVYKRYCPAGPNGQIELEELIHMGIVGLLEAKSRFDPNRGIPFLAFASIRIRGAMLDQIRRQPIVRTSQDLARKIKKLKKARESLLKEGKNPDHKQLAKKLEWSVEKVRKTMSHAVQIISVQENVGNWDGDEIAARGEIVRDKGPDAEGFLLRRELAESVQKCLEKLPSDELRLVLLGRILEGLRLRELAQVMSCSIQTIANRQETAQVLMRDCLEKSGWSPDDVGKMIK